MSQNPKTYYNQNRIIEQTNGGLDIFKHFIPDFKQPKKLFTSVFRTESEPSANIWKDKKGEYYYKDFGDDKALYPIEFVMRLQNCTFQEALAMCANLALVEPTEYAKEPEPENVIIYPTEDECKKVIAQGRGSLFYQAAQNLGITQEHLQKWNVGSKIIKDVDYACFVFQNKEGIFLNQKMMAYKPTHYINRDKEKNPISLKAKGKHESYDLCFFGEHLLSDDKVVCLVESEKTAIISSFFYPDYDFLATLGKQGLHKEKYEILKGRKIYILLDADEKARKGTKAVKICTDLGLDFIVRDLFPERADGYDLADAVIDGLRPDLAPAKKAIHEKTVAELETEIDELTVKVRTAEDRDSQEFKDLLESLNNVQLFVRDKRQQEEARELTDMERYGFWEFKGSYWSMKKDDSYEVSNFTIKILYHVKTGNNEAYRILEIKNKHGYKAVVNMNTDDFVSVDAFRKIVERNGNFLFRGDGADLFKIKEKLLREERTTELVNVLGYNKKPNFYSFANGIIDCAKLEEGVKAFKTVDEYGIVNHNEVNYFIPALSKMFADKEELFSNDKKFRMIFTKTKFEEWSEKHYSVYGEKSALGQVFYISSVFRDVIFKSLGGRFPLLFLYGQKGSGKGTFAQSIMKLFGEGQDQLMLSGASTVKAFMRKFAQFSNSIVWLDEYKNNLNKFFIESLKNIFDGIGYERAKVDSTFNTETTPIRCACLLSGQEMPTIEPALFSRTILISFKQTSFSEGDKVKFKELEAIETEGISCLTLEILKYRNLFDTQFKELFENEYKDLSKTINNPNIDDRLLITYSAMIAVCSLISTVIKLPFKVEDFKRFMRTNLSEQFQILNGTDDVSKFWNVIEVLFGRGLLKEGNEFEFKDGLLLLNFNQVHALYEQELRSRNDFHSLANATMKSYLQNSKGYAGDKERPIFRNGSRPRCLAFDYKQLEIDLVRLSEAERAAEQEKQTGQVEKEIAI